MKMLTPSSRTFLALFLAGILPTVAAPMLTPVTSTAKPAVQNSTPSGFSFVAGTLIAAKAGAEPIEKVDVGDHAWATDLQTRKSDYQKVSRVFTQRADDLVEVTTTSREKIECTPNTLFWVKAKSWIAAKSLFPGDQLLQRDGTFTAVFNVIPKHVSKVPVYSFEVEDFHTYYVGKYGILVHNSSTRVTRP